MPLIRFVRALFVLLCCVAPAALAQCDLVWGSANPRPDLTGSGRCSVLWDPDGPGPAATQLVVGGSGLVGGAESTGAKVMLFDGARWTPLGGSGPGTSGIVTDLVVWNGQLIAGGTFLGAGVDHLAAWSGSGWQPIGSGFPTTVYAMTVWNGSLVVGASNSSGPPTLRTWNGTTWTSLPSPPTLLFVEALTSYAGQLCVGGSDIGMFHGVVERWNGSQWSASILANPTNHVGIVHCFAVRPSLQVGVGDTLYVGGLFSSIGSSGPVTSIAATSPGGFTWSSVGANQNTDCTALHVRTSALTGFAVTARFANGGVQQFLSATGSWTPLGTAQATSFVRYAGSDHGTFVGSTSACNRYTGSAWVAVAGQGLVGEVRALVPSGDDIVVGGAFLPTSTLPLQHIARWNGTTFAALGTGMTGTSVDALLRRSNGEVVAGGLFSAADGTSANNIARWNGSSWSTFGTGTNQQVLAVGELHNGDLIAGGRFTQAGGVPCNRIARWNGSVWSSLNFGFNGDVLAVAVRGDGTLFAAGAFTSAGASSCSRIARWDGLVWQPLGSGLNGDVHALAFRPNGELVAVGAFTIAGGVAADRCAVWNGTAWASTGSNSGDATPARSVAVLPNGDVVVGRGFHQPGVAPDAGLARWNGTTWSGFGNGVAASSTTASANVRAIVQRADGLLVVGGDFGFANGGAASGGLVARGLATLAATCPASATGFGSACSSGLGVLSMTASTLPWIGSTLRTTTSNVPASALCFAVFGLSQVAIPLPALLPQGQAGCSLLASRDISLFAANGPGNAATAALVLPNTAGLVGVPFFAQTIPLEFDGSGAIAAVRASNGLSLVIGTL